MMTTWHDRMNLPPLETEHVDTPEAVFDAMATPMGATLEAVSGVVWAVRNYWGDHGYTLHHVGGGVFQVQHTDGSRFYLKGDRYGNVTEFIPKEGDTR